MYMDLVLSCSQQHYKFYFEKTHTHFVDEEIRFEELSRCVGK